MSSACKIAYETTIVNCNLKFLLSAQGKCCRILGKILRKKDRLCEQIRINSELPGSSCAALLLSRIGGGSGANGVVISEILASNSAYPDHTGEYRDFVELFNSGSREADLSGFGLTDSGSVKYRFPADTVLGAGDYLVVWCDSTGSEKAGIAPFSISRDGGETVALLSERGRVVDSVETVPVQRNQSMIPDGNGGWALSDTPTPGYPNTAEGYAAYLASRSAVNWTLQISEFMSSNTLYPAPDGQRYDWIELYNDGGEAVDLGGWSLSDTPDEPKHYFASGEVVPAGGYYVLWCGAGGAGFSLNHEGGETLCLLSPEGELADRIETPALEKNTAFARVSGGWEATAQATPGFANNEEGFEAYLGAMGWADCQVILSEAMAENRGCILDDFGACRCTWAAAGSATTRRTRSSGSSPPARRWRRGRICSSGATSGIPRKTAFITRISPSPATERPSRSPPRWVLRSVR